MVFNDFYCNGSDIMKCANCNRTLKNEIIAFCEKCEEMYSMNCCKDHSHGLTFIEYENDKLTTIPIGLTGMGYFDNHHKFYLEHKEILKHQKCSHVEDKLNKGLPIFMCEDGKIRCGDCFYNSNMETIQPYLKLNNKDKLIWLLPSTIDPFNLDFKFRCDDKGKKGESINVNIKIKNNKKNPIKQIDIFIGALAANPCPKNSSCSEYLDDLNPYYLICKDLHFNSIKSSDTLDIDFKLKIPKDKEIKINQFVEFYVEERLDNAYSENGLLNVPENLMIYTCFSYKTFSEHTFISYIETNIVNVNNSM